MQLKEKKGSIFSDPDYAITVCKTINTVRLSLGYIDERERVAKHFSTYVFHSEDSLETALKEARLERDELIKRPEYQEYLARSYSDPTGEKGINVRPRTHPSTKKGVVTALPGVFMKLVTTPSKSDGRPLIYLNVMANAPWPNGKTKYKGWSVRKYGLQGALRAAAEWRFDYVGDTPPTEEEIMLAESQVRAAYQGYLADV